MAALSAIAWAGCAPQAGPRCDDQPAPVAGQASSGSDGDSDGDSVAPLGLSAACSHTAEYWRRQFGNRGHAIASPPFVLAGTMDDAALRAWCEETVRPAALALGRQYFDRPPSRPITILLFADEATYRAEAERLFGDRAISRHGYYRPHLNTMLVNIAAGPSSLLHELVHALMAFDFPESPAWLREGLATLYEDCRMDAGALVPQAGARRATLDDALRQGRLPSLESLLGSPRFDGPDLAVSYALARHFCLYLTQEGKMAEVYRAMRDADSDDSDVMATILHVLELDSWAMLETDFRGWASSRD